MKKFSTKHTRDTKNPQIYREHFMGAFFGSLQLIGYGLVGLIRAFLRKIKMFHFFTSSGIIRAYKSLEESYRHDLEIQKIFSLERLEYVQKHRGK